MFATIVDNDISLALVQPSFAHDYFDIVSRDRDYLAQWLTWPVHADGIAFFEGFIRHSLHDYADGKSLTCAMLYQGAVVGNISFNTISHDLKKVQIGYWVCQNQQGKGIVSRCVKALVHIAFEKLGMEKVEISAATENAASRAVCERLGFTLEGVIRQAEKLDDRIVDHAVYGLYRSENVPSVSR
ncbi:GNAT family N-acetyltransferase [Enterovibrio norvegicus]|uniref:GNAT family N-acetyltransferase n=1 Tax=Enterovibrio norvegicus TaxID=188144 RepID=UPI00354E3177